MSELVLVIRKPLHDFDMQGWCEMLFDSPFLRGLTPDQLTELMLTLASEVGTFDLLEDLADTYVAIEHSTPVPTAQDMYNEVMRLRAEVARLQALWDAVQKIDGWRDSHLLDGIYFCTGSKWHAGGDSALLGKGNGALELNWRGLWEPRHEDDVTVEAPTMREVIIALAAKLEEEA